MTTPTEDVPLTVRAQAALIGIRYWSANAADPAIRVDASAAENALRDLLEEVVNLRALIEPPEVEALSDAAQMLARENWRRFNKEEPGDV